MKYRFHCQFDYTHKTYINTTRFSTLYIRSGKLTHKPSINCQCGITVFVHWDLPHLLSHDLILRKERGLRKVLESRYVILINN